MGGKRSTAWGDYRVTESGLYLRDTTIADVSTARHGLTPKLPNDATQFLNGVGGWAVPPGSSQGGLVFRERHSAAGGVAQLDFTTFLDAAYDKYLIIGEGIVAQTSTAHLYLEVGTGGGPTYDTGNNYEWARIGVTTSGTGANDSGSTGIARLFTSMGTTAGWAGSFALNTSALVSTSLRKTFHGTTHYINSSPVSVIGSTVIQWTTTGTAVSALRFIMSSGNIAAGTITIAAYTNS